MQKQLIDRIRKGLVNYEKRIRETDEHYDELERYGRYQPGAPYGLKFLIPYWISLIQEEENRKEFQIKFDELTEKLHALEKKRGREFREKLLADLKRTVDQYPTIVCYFAYLEPLDLEVCNDLLTRGAIEILLIELKNDFNLDEIKKKVDILDEVLKCTYSREVENIIKYCPKAEDPLSPPNFWWDHPLKLIKDKGEK